VGQHRAVCPECDLRLGGIRLARGREVSDVPPPPAVQITDHRIVKGGCAGCQTWHEAPVDRSDEVLGQGRRGVRLASTIASLRPRLRVPLRHIRERVCTRHGLEVRRGAIVEVLHRISTHAQPRRDALLTEIRASPTCTPMTRVGETMASLDLSGA